MQSKQMSRVSRQAEWASLVFRNVHFVLSFSADNSNPPRPVDDVPGHSVSHANEIRGDIIQFYNNVYMPRVQKFAPRFSNETDVSRWAGSFIEFKLSLI